MLAGAVKPLTKMELSILECVACGKTNQDIADIFGRSVTTIKNHLQHIEEKLGTQNRAAALWQAIATGQLSPPQIQVPVFEERTYDMTIRSTGKWRR